MEKIITIGSFHACKDPKFASSTGHNAGSRQRFSIFAYNCAPYQKILKADKAEKEAAVADEPKKGNRRSCDPDNDQLANDCRSKYHNACLLKYACIDSRFNRSSNFAAESNFLQAT